MELRGRRQAPRSSQRRIEQETHRRCTRAILAHLAFPRKADGIRYGEAL